MVDCKVDSIEVQGCMKADPFISQLPPFISQLEFHPYFCFLQFLFVILKEYESGDMSRPKRSEELLQVS